MAALDGVETIVRNSDVHHEYKHLDGGVRFIHRDPCSKTVTEKVMNDEEFGELVRKIVRTVLSFSVAAQLFQCDHIRKISSDLYGVETPRVLCPTYLQLLLGLVGAPGAQDRGGGQEGASSRHCDSYIVLLPVWRST